MKIRITGMGLPKAQMWNSQPGVEMNMTPYGARSYSWANMNTQPMPTPPQQTQYMINTQGTPVAGSSNIVPLQNFGNAILSTRGSDLSGDKDTDENKANSMLASWSKPGGDVSRKEMKRYINEFNEQYDSNYQLLFMGPRMARATKAAGIATNALAAIGTALDYFDANRERKNGERGFREMNMDPAPSPTQFRGIENINTGRMFENMLPKPNVGRFEDGGENMEQSMRIRIIAAPDKMEYGGQSNYGLDLGRRKVYTDMPESRSESVSSSVSAVPRESANIEAEGGETLYGDLDGDGGMEHMKISGPRHTDGGVPLNVPEGSFIFSDTAKMRIKDPEVLKYFGLLAKKGGYTPAEIAKRYDINKYKAIMEDESADELNKSTAQLMMENYNKKLAQLSMIQESMKGFPQGVPQVAEGKINEAAYGGRVLPKYQGLGNSTVTRIPDQYRLPRLNTPAPAATSEYNTVSPAQLADTNDPEFVRYMGLVRKYDAKNRQGYNYINNMSDADAAEFARLATKFGFRGTDPSGKTSYRVVQGATPSFGFVGSDKKRKGFFGGYRPEQYERRVVEDVVGPDGIKNMSELDIRKAYFKELGIDISGMNDDQLKDSKRLYTNPAFFEKSFYPKFTQRFAKNNYRTMLGDDQLIGAEHYDAYRDKPKPTANDTTVTGFICKGLDAKGVPMVESSSFMNAAAMAESGAFSSQQEATMNCGINVSPNTVSATSDTRRERARFLTPDKLAMAAAAAIPPKMYGPYYADMAYRPGQLALEDWLSQAQNVQQTYNTTANTLGTYSPASGLASNLSFMAGQAGDQTSRVISEVGNRNVERFNQFSGVETQRQQAVDAYNTAAKDKRWEGMTIANQNLDNSRRKYINNLTKSVNNGWNNRMMLDMINNVNPFYNVSPVSGLSYFKSGYGPDQLGGRSAIGGGTGSSNLGAYDGLARLKRELMGKGMSETNAENKALKILEGGSSSYTDTDMDGYPNRVSTTQRGAPANYMSNMATLYNGIRGSIGAMFPFGGQPF